MKIVLIGANGTIGRAVSGLLEGEGIEIIKVGLTSGIYQVDISSQESIASMFAQTGSIDGIICVAGSGYYGPLDKMGTKEVFIGINSKLLGQVNLVQIGKDYLKDNGFLTLTSGYLAEEGDLNSANLGLINGALNGFVVNASLEMPRGIRLNIVSPSVLEESIPKYGAPKSRYGIPAREVAAAYKETVYGGSNGQILKAYGKPR